MKPIRFQNVSGNKIAVTTAAATIQSLVNTAVGSTEAIPANLDAIDIFAEDGDIRFLADGNTPTASIGFLIPRGTIAKLRGINVDHIKLISTGKSSVVCQVSVGAMEEDECSEFHSLISTISSSDKLAAITPHDSNKLQYNSVNCVTKGIYVGGAGNMVVKNSLGSDVTLTGVLAGVVYPITAEVVKSTGTTATNLVAIFQ